MMNRTVQIALLLLFAASLQAQTIEVANIKKHVEYLASDKLKGRGTSSKGEAQAAAYIAKSFESSGLAPKGTKGYYYPFEFKKSANMHDTSTANAKPRKGKNVVGYLDNGAQYTIVIGAHYDHLGLGHDHNSTDANPEGKIHNGADDNASGTAGVMELARYFGTNKEKEKYNFLFICFSGEELGLYGSKKYCENPTIELANVNYMINMDMIGRLNDTTKKLIIYGVGTAPDWVPMIDNMKSEFSIKKDSAGVGPSDQTSFYLKNIPVLHFFTGQHPDYHKPTDDADKVNYEGEKKVLDYIIAIVGKTESLPKLKFLETKSSQENTPKFKVTLGIMPDYAYEGKGVHVDGVTNGKPGAIAGLKKGDIITTLNGDPINNMMDYMKALAKCKKGDTVPVKVKRGTEELEMKVTF